MTEPIKQESTENTDPFKRLRKTYIVFGAITLGLAIISIILGGFMPLFSIAFGILFLYYLGTYALSYGLSKLAIKPSIYIGYFLLIIPILCVLFDAEGFFNFLLQGISLDMK